jgi:GLPGLI family protein
MKKQFLFFALLGLIFASNCYAQKPFEGVIIYTIEYDDLPEEMEAMKAMLPTESIIKIKGSKTRTEQSMMGMGTTIAIYDAETETAITLMNMMTNKAAITTTKKDMKKTEQEKEPKIVYIDETKEIAGYKCKKAEITYNNEDEVMIVYYTEEINTKDTKSQYKGLKGFPMQYEINNEGIKMVMTVKEVKKEKVSASEFTIPKGYEVMTMEEFQNKMTQQMMGE